ncbi:MAG: succinate dehydrogenase, cytochrome b556 subunit [Candidatus Promineifilaceae bacterium]
MTQDTSTSGQALRPRRPLRAWFGVGRSRLGGWAFALNRLTSLGLTAYLFIHLIVLSTLTRGQSGWDNFIAIVRSPVFLALDVLLLAGILFHGLNGIRVALVGMGVGRRSHRALFWLLMALGLVLLAVSAWRVFTI